VVGVAALLDHAALRGGRAATVLCGSNLTADQVACWLT
jgi:threonine dehydratase